MRRPSRASVINDIERILKSGDRLGKYRWETNGVECTLDRHTYYGALYSFDVEVLRVRATARPKWQLYLIPEFWRNEAGEAVRINSTFNNSSSCACDF